MGDELAVEQMVLKALNTAHAKPEFLPAGDKQWLVIVNDDGLSALQKEGKLTQEQVDHIKTQIPAAKDPLHQSTTPADGGRYSIVFEGNDPSTAKATSAMSGNIDLHLYAILDQTIYINSNNALDLTKKDSTAHVAGPAIFMVLDPQYKPKEIVQRYGQPAAESAANIINYYAQNEINLNAANAAHSKPEFTPAGDKQWLVIVNDDGLSALQKDGKLTQERVNHIKEQFPIKKADERDRDPAGSRRYSMVFEGDSLSNAQATGVVAGTLDLNPSGFYLSAESALNLTQKNSLARDMSDITPHLDRSIHNPSARIDEHFKPKIDGDETAQFVAKRIADNVKHISRPAVDAQADIALRSHPEFIPAGDKQWLVIVNNDGLNALLKQGHLTKDTAKLIKNATDTDSRGEIAETAFQKAKR